MNLPDVAVPEVSKLERRFLALESHNAVSRWQFRGESRSFVKAHNTKHRVQRGSQLREIALCSDQAVDHTQAPLHVHLVCLSPPYLTPGLGSQFWGLSNIGNTAEEGMGELPPVTGVVPVSSSVQLCQEGEVQQGQRGQDLHFTHARKRGHC